MYDPTDGCPECGTVTSTHTDDCGYLARQSDGTDAWVSSDDLQKKQFRMIYRNGEKSNWIDCGSYYYNDPASLRSRSIWPGFYLEGIHQFEVRLVRRENYS